MKVEFKFSNGDEVREKITGFRGVITGSVTYLTGCNQYLLTAKSKTERKQATTLWYDEGRLELIRNAITAEEVKADDNGCDIQAPMK